MRTFKLYVMLVISLGLSGCAHTGDFSATLDQSLETALNAPVAEFRTKNRDIFSYYLPIHMGRIDAGPSSVRLLSRNQVIVLNVDVINLLNQAYYRSVSNPLRDAINRDAANYVREGYLKRMDDVSVPYLITVSSLSESTVFVQVQTDALIISSIHPVQLTPEMLGDMVGLARTTVVNNAAVLTTFSNREVISFQRESLNIFSQIAPESGTVIDMITDPDSIIFDESLQESYEQYQDLFE